MLMLILIVRKVNGAILIGILGTTLLGIFRGMSRMAHGACFGAASFAHVSEVRFARRAASRALRNHVRISVRRSLRQRGHARRRLRASGISSRMERFRAWAAPCSRMPSERVWLDDGNVHGHELHRKRGGSAAGARTGLSNIARSGTVSGGDVFCARLRPRFRAFATAPALILVGALMIQSVARVKWDDFSDAFPAFVTILATPLTFSIATGLSLGLISYTVVKIAAGKFARSARCSGSSPRFSFCATSTSPLPDAVTSSETRRARLLRIDHAAKADCAGAIAARRHQ